MLAEDDVGVQTSSGKLSLVVLTGLLKKNQYFGLRIRKDARTL